MSASAGSSMFHFDSCFLGMRDSDNAPTFCSFPALNSKSLFNHLKHLVPPVLDETHETSERRGNNPRVLILPSDQEPEFAPPELSEANSQEAGHSHDPSNAPERTLHRHTARGLPGTKH